MADYLNKLQNSRIPENKGYNYITTETIFIPIFRVDLTVIKRKIVSLTLLEEIILRVVNEGVSDIDEICGVLGIDRDIVTVAMADLHIQDLIYNTSNTCIISAKGKDALKRLEVAKREIDVLHNLYVNSGNNTISLQASQWMTDNYTLSDHIVCKDESANLVDFYKSHIDELKDIFQEYVSSRTSALMDRSAPLDELINIENVEIKRVHYMRMPIHIFVSSTGSAFDIIPAKLQHHSVFNSIKSDLISRIKQGNLLKDIFFSERKYQNTSTLDLPNIDIIGRLKSIRQDNIHELYPNYESIILSDRCVSNNEIDILFEYLANNCNSVRLLLNNLDSFIYSSKFMTWLSSIPANVTLEITYANCSNLDKAFDAVRRVRSGFTKANMKNDSCNEWVSIEFDAKHCIICIPECHLVKDVARYLLELKYFITLKKS